MSFVGHLRYYAGILLIIFGLFLTFGGVVQLNEGKESIGSFLALVFFIGVLPTATGAWMVYTAKKTGRIKQQQKQEKEVMEFAMKSGGNITIAQTAMLTSLSPSEAEKLLTNMQEQGVFVLKVSESGHIVYQIAGLLGKDEKLIDV